MSLLLEKSNYTLTNALCGGNYKLHYQLAGQEGWGINGWGHRIIYVLEITPIIGQIISLFEMILARTLYCLSKEQHQKLDNKKFKAEDLMISQTTITPTNNIDDIPFQPEIDLKNFGVKKSDIQEIINFTTSNKLNQNTHYRKNEDRKLSFVVDEKNQIILLLKGKNITGKKLFGTGAYNKVTACYHLNQQKFIAFRSGYQTISASKSEISNNEKLKASKDFFVTGDVVIYKGKSTLKRFDPTKIGWIMDCCENGDLSGLSIKKENETQSKWNQLDVELKKKIISDIAKSLDCLHNTHQIVHRDLKPANIMLTKDYQAKLIDFAFSQEIGISGKQQGTPIYCPPEYWQALKSSNLYVNSPKFDMWSLGITLSMLKSPTNTRGFFKKIIWLNNGHKVIDYSEENIKVNVKDLLTYRKKETHIDYIIYRCLAYHPQERATAKEILDHLEKVTNFD